MKKLSLLFFVFHFSFFTFHFAYGQWGCSCLPDGITFQTQSQIDSFQVNYPGCTEIEGEVFIGSEIRNLFGLSVLTAIGDNLNIQNNDSLSNLWGLQNLVSIEGTLKIAGTELNNLSGLNSLTTIGENLVIGLSLHANYGTNWFLTSLDELASLTSIGGYLHIESNHSLTSLSGIENLAAGSITDLYIANNPNLSYCDEQNICEYLAAPNGIVEIHDNAPGCDGVSEVGAACQLTQLCLPYGKYYFSSQDEVDLFPSVFNGCNHLQGDVIISDLTNLAGLSGVNSISGTLSILYNHRNDLDGLQGLSSIGGGLNIAYGGIYLTGLNGLNGLTTVGEDVVIMDNPLLVNLEGLNNLDSIGGSLIIGGRSDFGNPSLISLEALENLTSIDSDLYIRGNSTLPSLNGLENIAPGSIHNIFIGYNEELSSCDVQSICEYLASPGGTVIIGLNAPGCNSPGEVMEACAGVGVEEPAAGSRQSAVICYPNPTDGVVNFQFTVYNLESVILKIYNAQGQEVATVFDGKWSGGQVVRWDASALPAGIYYYRLTTDDRRLTTGTGKIVKY